MKTTITKSVRTSLLLSYALVWALAFGANPTAGQDLSFLTNGLVGHWSFEEGQGAVANDSSGYGNNGTVHPGASWVEGKIGNALYFNAAADSFVLVPLSPSLNVSTGLTISAWINSENTDGAKVIVSKWDDCTWQHSYIFKDWNWSDKLSIELTKGTGTRSDLASVQGSSGIIPGEWMHAVATFSAAANQVRLYVNGQFDAQATTSGGEIQPTLADLVIGATGGLPDCIAEHFQGLIDEVRIYSRTLSATEVQALYDYESRAELTLQPASASLAENAGTTSIILHRLSDTNDFASYTYALTGGTATPGVDFQLFSGEFDLNEGVTWTTLPLTLLDDALIEGPETVILAVTNTMTGWGTRLLLSITDDDVLYFSNFETGAGAEWSNRSTDVTPVGNRRFLGQFCNDTVNLTLTALPPHGALTVSFDLFILLSWDGNWSVPGEGPDVWDLRLAEGPTLLHATFANTLLAGQSYPDMYPGADYPLQTGATEINTLGYPSSGDAVYHVSFTFPHNGNSLRLDFSGIGLEGIWNESWGLDNVMVAVNPLTNQPPIIFAQPTDQEVPSGATVTFAPSILGSSPMACQWYRNWVALQDGGRIAVGEDGTLTISTVEADDAGIYWLEISNEFGSATSEPVWLSVLYSPPRITLQPQKQTVFSSNTVTFTVAAEGSLPLFYQWLFNGRPILGATHAALSLTNLSTNQAGIYSVVVSNAFGATLSSNALLTVLDLATTTVFDIRKDFPISSNPQGPWALGWFQSLNSPFHVHTNCAFDAVDTDGMFAWWTPLSPEGHLLPVIAFNPTDSTIYADYGPVYEPGHISVHPAFEYSVLRWTAPASGVCLVSAIFSGLLGMGQPWGSDAHVSHNGVSVFGVIVSGETDEHSYTGTIEVAAGDTIDFAVGPGNDGTFHGDSTELRATITFTLSGENPRLSIELASPNVVVRWPAHNSAGFHLEAATRLQPPDWAAVTTPPVQVGDYYTVTLPATNAHLFFRLVKTPTPIPPPPSLIAWWSGDDTALDLVGANHGTLMNGATFAPGMVGRAFSFDGVDDYIEVPDSDLWAFGNNDFTIELWALFKSVRHSGHISWPEFVFIGNDEGSGYLNKWIFLIGGGFLELIVDSPYLMARFIAASLFTPEINQWYHFAVSRQGDLFTTYVNGAPFSWETHALEVPNAAAPLTIGQAEGGGFMDGLIDELAIYNRALTAAEIKAIYDAGSAGKIKPSP